MEPSEQSHNQAGSDAVNGVSAASSRVVRRSSSSQRRNGRPKGDPFRKSPYAVYDCNSPGYEWLQPGWIVAEYLAKSGRTYKVESFVVSFIVLYFQIKLPLYW